MMTKEFNAIIEKLDPETPNAYVFVIQAGNEGGELALTEGQIETARNAAKSVLEITGATVTATASVIALDPISEGETARLRINCAQEVETETPED